MDICIVLDRSLKELTKDLNLNEHIVFNTSFIPDEDLWTFLRSTDVYINAYIDQRASVSGTLIMAMGFGVPCISTPYPFAKEMLVDNGGILVRFSDSNAIANAVIYILEDRNRSFKIGQNGASRTFEWPEVAKMVLSI